MSFVIRSDVGGLETRRPTGTAEVRGKAAVAGVEARDSQKRERKHEENEERRDAEGQFEEAGPESTMPAPRLSTPPSQSSVSFGVSDGGRLEVRTYAATERVMNQRIS